MAEEFQAGVCNGNWWNPSRFSSPCSTAINGMASFGWPNDMVEIKERSCEETTSASDSSIIFQEKPQQVDSTLQIMGFGLSSASASSSSSDWNQNLLREKCGNNYNSMLNYIQETEMDSSQIQKSYSFIEQQSLSSMNNSGSSTGFSSLVYPSTTLLQSLFDSQPSIYSSTPDYSTNYTNELPSSWPKLKQSVAKQQHNNLQFSNNTPFWNASAAAAAVNDIQSNFSSSESQFLAPVFEEKPNYSNLSAKVNSNEEIRDSGSMMKKVNEPAFKRPRIETPSPLPTFKVRKEKLGDRITALQQLVSPFGKTDTASVLHEAIEYIKFLHDQVTVLSTPYMNNGAHVQHQQVHDKLKEGSKQDLKSQGLCLVPISSTFPVANQTTDFWAPTFGGAVR